MMRFFLVVCLAIGYAIVPPSSSSAQWESLEYAPAPLDNPLKGLVPYQADVREFFPHSLEFNYLPYSALVKGYDEFDWGPLEDMLNDVASRGHQAVIRIFLEYPDKKNVIPAFLIKDGLEVHKYLNTNTQPFPPAQVETPNYEDHNLRRSLKNFLSAFGKKYDGDVRLGFITAGLLGTWGEWHNFPRDELFASQAVQLEVMIAYEAAFKTTPVLLRYPVGSQENEKASNSRRPFGYHDDSFAWATLDTGQQHEDWFYMALLKAAGPAAQAKWKQHPIAGEIRPEAWGKVFDAQPGDEQIQNFLDCVEATHVSWLMDSGMFQSKQQPTRIERATEQVRRMGYEFYAPRVNIGRIRDGQLPVSVELENRGVAPFYYDWNGQWALLSEGSPPKTFSASGKLTNLLPGDPPRQWSESLDVSEVEAGKYALGIRVLNPLPGGKSLRFANQTQEVASQGWLVLGPVEIR